jgi:hypothetical protein
MKRAAVLGGIIALGLLSRAWPVGFFLWDKYLGDALYAAMVYCLIGWKWDAPPRKLALASMAVMTAIEAFQLTGLASGWIGRVLGTYFSWFDLAAYVVGILAAWGIDHRARMTG